METVLSSNLSSINEEEFDGDLSLPSPVVAPITKFFPAKIDVIVEITTQWRKVKTQMKVFTVNDLKITNRKVRFPTVSEKNRNSSCQFVNLV